MRSQEQLDQSPTKKQSSAASPTLARPSQGEEAFASVTLETDEAILAEGRRIVFLCCFVGVISSLDRQAMSVAIVPMSKAMGYSDTIKGSISSVFSFGYTLALVPLGLAVLRFGRIGVRKRQAAQRDGRWLAPALGTRRWHARGSRLQAGPRAGARIYRRPPTEISTWKCVPVAAGPSEPVPEAHATGRGWRVLPERRAAPRRHERGSA